MEVLKTDNVENPPDESQECAKTHDASEPQPDKSWDVPQWWAYYQRQSAADKRADDAIALYQQRKTVLSYRRGMALTFMGEILKPRGEWGRFCDEHGLDKNTVLRDCKVYASCKDCGGEKEAASYKTLTRLYAAKGIDQKKDDSTEEAAEATEPDAGEGAREEAAVAPVNAKPVVVASGANGEPLPQKSNDDDNDGEEVEVSGHTRKVSSGGGSGAARKSQLPRQAPPPKIFSKVKVMLYDKNPLTGKPLPGKVVKLGQLYKLVLDDGKNSEEFLIDQSGFGMLAVACADCQDEQDQAARKNESEKPKLADSKKAMTTLTQNLATDSIV